jgi:hypothetical protein
MDEEEAPPELRPARPDAAAGEGKAYMPRLPILWIALGIAVLLGLFSAYFWRQKQRADTLRGDMLRLHEEQLGEMSDRYLAFRRRIEGLTQRAAQAGEPEDWSHPRLNIAGLRAGDGLYLRVPAREARDPRRLRQAAGAMQPDSITRCLGLAPMSARGLYEKGAFLTPEWVRGVRREQNLTRLKVIEDQIRRYVRVDVPVLATMMQADWFMLVIEQGENRRQHPVDVFLWDLRRNRQLLRARIQGRGLLIPVRLRFEGANPAPAPGRPPGVNATEAQDCSIASQIRGLAGPDPLEVQSAPQILDAARRHDEEAQEATPDAPRERAPAPAPE